MEWKNISIGLGIIISATILIGTGYSLDIRYNQGDKVLVLSENIKQLRKDYNTDYTERRLKSIQERKWFLEDRHGSYSQMPQTVKEEYRRLTAEEAKLILKLETLIKSN